MNIKELTKRAKEISEKYDKLNKVKGEKEWGLSERTQGLI